MTFDQFYELKEGDRIHWEPPKKLKDAGVESEDGTVESHIDGKIRVVWDKGFPSVIYMWEKDWIEQITKIG